MGKIETTYDQTPDLTTFKVVGKLKADEVHEWQIDQYSGTTTTLHLWDLTDADLSGITIEDILEDVRRTKMVSNARTGGKTAFVTDKNLEFGISRMNEAYTEIENLPVAYRTFRTIAEARKWLGV